MRLTDNLFKTFIVLPNIGYAQYIVAVIIAKCSPIWFCHLVFIAQASNFAYRKCSINT